MSKKEKTIQSSLDELHDSINKLSDNSITIENSIKEYSKTAKLIEDCFIQLKSAKLQVEEIDLRLIELEEKNGF